MSENPSGIEFLKRFNPFNNESSRSFLVDNKNGLPREKVRRFTDAYQRLEASKVIEVMQTFIRNHTRPQNNPFAGLELVTREDGITGDGYYVFFDRADVKVPAAPGVKDGLNTKFDKGRLLLKNQQVARGVKVVQYADGKNEVYAYMGTTKNANGETVKAGGRWDLVEQATIGANGLQQAGVMSTPYFITESKNTCIIMNPAPELDASKRPKFKVILKP
jgi:hypothetical protein